MAAWVKGISVDEFNALADEIIDDLLLPSVYQKAREEITYHKMKRARTVILSSAPDYVCRRMAAETGIDDIICSVLEEKNGILTGLSVRPLCYGKEKAVRLKEYCEKNNIAPSECWYYGDSGTDVYALSAAGYQVCVNPERELLRKAREKSWKVVRWEK